MESESSLIVAPPQKLELFTFNESAKKAKAEALEKAALIGKVVDGDSKIIAVRAQQALKKVMADIEKARKEHKEPLLQAGRQLDTICAAETLDLDKEFGRVSNAVREFDDAERRRVAEEQRLQREELERIEREKQAEIERIAREQREREEAARRIQEEDARKVREAAAAAARLASEATNKKQREAAEKARIESEKLAEAARIERERMDSVLKAESERAAAESAAIEEKAGDAAYVAGRPVEITTVAGQRTNHTWEITKINDWTLAKARPDLVRKIEFDMRGIKEALNRGDKLPGVEAKEVYNADVRVPTERKAINV